MQNQKRRSFHLVLKDPANRAVGVFGPQIQMVELLVANGASLDTKSVLEETPMGETR